MTQLALTGGPRGGPSKAAPASPLSSMLTELDLERLSVVIPWTARAKLGEGRFALLLPEGGRARCRGTAGLDAETARALERRAALAFSVSPPSTPEIVALEPPEGGDALGAKEVLCAPLVARDEAHGLLVAMPEDGQRLSAEVVAGLRAHAEHAAIAVCNARRFTAAEDRGRRDPLTDLLNQREFHRELDRALETARRDGGELGVTVVDVDHFKRVNDRDGHEAGDRLLQGVAKKIAGVSRETDGVFRIGGDEFAVLTPRAGAATADALAERIGHAVAHIEPPVSVSCGTASWPHDGPNKTRLLAAADRRLNGVKKGRRSEAVKGPAGGSSARQRERLAVASRLSARLAPLLDVTEIARITVAELHHSFEYYLAVVQRLHPDGVLRVVAAAGPLTEALSDFIELEQPVTAGVNGRVARSGEPALVRDTRADPDYLLQNPDLDPRSELSVPIRVEGEVWGVLNLEQLAADAFDEDDLLLVDTITAQVGAAIHRHRLFEEVEGALLTTLGMLSDGLERKDEYTALHAEEVAMLAQGVGIRLGMAGDELRALRYAALLHDVGKIGVRGELLTKPGPLTEPEMAEVRRHTEIGAEMLSRVPFFGAVHPIVRASHERWDGRGYPDGLAGESIPLAARIVFACDAFHAMTSDRPYRAALDRAKAIAELRDCAGTQFDPTVAEALIAELSG